MDSLMITLVARYKAKANEGDAVERALREMISLARQEEGCICFYANRSEESPDEFLLYEQYESEAALQKHRETPHFKRIIEGNVILLLEKRERSIYRPIEL